MSSNIRITRICHNCGAHFEARTTVTKYCGDRRAKLAYKARIRGTKVAQSDMETKAVIDKPLTDLKDKEYLSVMEVAKLLNSSKQTVYTLIRSGVIHAVNLKKKKTVVPRAGIDALFRLPDISSAAAPKTLEEHDPPESMETYSLADVREKFGLGDSTKEIVKITGRGRW